MLVFLSKEFTLRFNIDKDDVKLMELSGLITEKLHNVNGIVLNFNPHKTNEILGKENIPVWGNATCHMLVFLSKEFTLRFNIHNVKKDIAYPI